MISFFIGFWENVKIAVRALIQNKMRAVLTTLGIIIGVLTVVSVASIIEGLNKGFAKQIASLGSNTLYVQKFPWVSGDEWFKYRNRPNIEMKDAEYVRKYLKSVEAVSPSTGSRQNLKYAANSLLEIRVTGVTMESEKIEEYNIADGRYFNSIEIEKEKNNAVIGWEIMDKLFEGRNPIGQRMKVGDVSYTVIGVMGKRGSIMGESMDSEVYVPIGSLLKNFGVHRSIQIVVKVRDAAQVESVKDDVRFLMRTSRGLKPHEEDNFSINQQEAIMEMYNKLTSGLYTAAIGIGALSLLVGGIGIMNIMLVSVAERKNEIGIRMALGAKRKVITIQFIIESVIICTIGGLIAILLSYVVSQVISKVTPFPSVVPLWSVFMGLGFSTFIGLFFGIYPARKASKLDPIECLRYE
ncbi:MAG: ABC transporter permease [Candidatus Neomarinimicrobiota bacterium]